MNQSSGFRHVFRSGQRKRLQRPRYTYLRKLSGTIQVVALISLSGSTGCGGISPPPNVRPREANVVSLNPRDWYIFYSDEMDSHPTANPTGAWSFEFPSGDGHVNYIQTPLNVTTIPHSISMTFRVESESPQYRVTDSDDTLPATVHLFIEQQNDDLRDPDGRWWSHEGGYSLGSQDNNTITFVVPLTPDNWTNVIGQRDTNSFYAALGNIGWIGVTYGGQKFFGHGVGISNGKAKYVLVSFSIE
jgi:hypothetical protein